MYNGEKVKVVQIFCFTAGILTNVLQKWSLSSALSNIWILSNRLSVIGRHYNQKVWNKMTVKL